MKNTFLALLLALNATISLNGEDKRIDAKSEARVETSVNNSWMKMVVEERQGNYEIIDSPSLLYNRVKVNWKNEFNSSRLLGYYDGEYRNITDSGRNLLEKSIFQSLREGLKRNIPFQDWGGDIKFAIEDAISGNEELNTVSSPFRRNEGIPGTELAYIDERFTRTFAKGIRPFSKDPYAYMTLHKSQVGTAEFRIGRIKAEAAVQVPLINRWGMQAGVQRNWRGGGEFENYVGIGYFKKDEIFSLGVSGFRTVALNYVSQF